MAWRRDPRLGAPRAAWLAGAWVLLLLCGYAAGRAFTSARLGWDVGLSTDMPSIRGPAATDAMRALTDVGSPAALDGVFVVASAVLVLRRRLRALMYFVLCAGGTILLAQILKLWVGRARPDVVSHLVHAAGASWPSGHASSAAAIFGALAVLASSRLRSHGARVALAAATVALVAGIGFSRVYLGVHYGTDVLGGWVLGGAWLAVVTRRALRPRARR